MSEEHTAALWNQISVLKSRVDVLRRELQVVQELIAGAGKDAQNLEINRLRLALQREVVRNTELREQQRSIARRYDELLKKRGKDPLA